jgi:hypothetical protein
MQKLANPFTTTPILRPKVHETTHELLHPIHQPRHSTIPIRNQKLVEVVKPKVKTWQPIPSAYYAQGDSDTEEDSNQDSSDSDNDVQEEQPQENNLQQMAAWLQNQRLRTTQALHDQQNAIHAFIPPPQPNPPPPRQAKLSASQAIRETGTRRKTPKIPQLEGAEITPELTPDSSFVQDNHYLSPEIPWSPNRQEDYSEGDLDTLYQRHIEDEWEWDHTQQQLSFLEPPSPLFQEEENNYEEDDYYNLPSQSIPQRRHSFNGFVLPTTFTKRRI